MVRWEPGAAERLQAAALELFATRGFEPVTAAEIAHSVGLTERTFFRHFSDKREVLFYGQQQFLQAFTDGAEAAPPGASPLEVIACVLHAAASLFPGERRPYARMRQSVIDQNPALRERELHKLASLAAAVAAALRARGTGEPAATLAAQSGATVFGIAFAQWTREGEQRSLDDITSDVLHELLHLTATATGSRNLPIAGTAYGPTSGAAHKAAGNLNEGPRRRGCPGDLQRQDLPARTRTSRRSTFRYAISNMSADHRHRAYRRISRGSRDQRSSRSATGVPQRRRTERRIRAAGSLNAGIAESAQMSHSGVVTAV